jgi:hypothetical protein
MGKTVMTVTGPVPVNRLGVTLMHEHFTFAYPGWFADDSLSPYNRDTAEAACLKVLEDVKKFGVQTIVDATAADVGGRDPVLLKNLSEKSPEILRGRMKKEAIRASCRLRIAGCLFSEHNRDRETGYGELIKGRSRK